VAVVLLNK